MALDRRLALLNASYRLWQQFTASRREGAPARKPRPLPGDVVAGLAAPIAEKLDRTAGWDRLPPRLAVLTLLGIRHRLRARNLYEVAADHDTAAPPADVTAARALDGSGNDPAKPRMGAAKTPFGRNAPPVLETATIGID